MTAGRTPDAGAANDGVLIIRICCSMDSHVTRNPCSGPVYHSPVKLMMRMIRYDGQRSRVSVRAVCTAAGTTDRPCGYD